MLGIVVMYKVLTKYHKRTYLNADSAPTEGGRMQGKEYRDRKRVQQDVKAWQ